MYSLLGFKVREKTLENGSVTVSYNFYLSSPISSNQGQGLECFELWQPQTKVSFTPKVGMELDAVIFKRGDSFYIDHLEMSK